MRRFIIILQFLPLLAQPSNGQRHATGVYLVVKCVSEMKKYTSVIDGKTVCLTDLPVVQATEFLSVSELHEFPGQGYIFFEFSISDVAFQKLKSLDNRITDVQFAFVVDETLLFVTDGIAHKSHRLISEVKSKEFFAAYEKLKKITSPP